MKNIVIYTIVALLSIPILSSCGKSEDKQPPILDRLSTYDPGPRPPIFGEIGKDPYDSRLSSGVAVPKKNVALVVDVCQLALIDDSTFKPNLASQDVVTSTISRYYESKDWIHIPGLRPWAHSRFVKSLTKNDRERLVDEIVATLKSGRISIEDCSK